MVIDLSIPLAETGAQTSSGSIFVWSLILFALVVGGFVIVSWVRRKVSAPEQGVSVGFTLADLREMRRQGQISEEEFERAKGRILATMKHSERKTSGADEPGKEPGPRSSETL